MKVPDEGGYWHNIGDWPAPPDPPNWFLIIGTIISIIVIYQNC